MTNKLRGNPKTTVFTEGTDPHILEVTSCLLASNFLKLVLVGNPATIEVAVEDTDYDIRDVQIVDPESFGRFDEMVEMFCETRKLKSVTLEQTKKIPSGASCFGTVLIKMDIGDCLLGGATYSTADAIRSVLQIIRTKPGSKIVSSCFILARPSATGDNELLTMADCTINIKPTEDEFVEICDETVNYAEIFNVGPKVTFLSYSTVGSGSGEDVDRMRNVYAKIKAAFPDEATDGEVQFDTVVSPTVARTKIKDSEVADHANTFIFPGTNAGNIGYKIAQRLGGFDAYGSILLGLSAPINGPSRGCNALEVYSMAVVAVAFV